MIKPTVDVLMATRNGESYLPEQIESVLAQDYENIRLLISDDCSDDGTLDIAHRYAMLDPRVRVVSEGVSFGSARDNFFNLLARSSAPYVAFCDQDDLWLSDKLSKCLSLMAKLEAGSSHDTPVAVFSDMAVADEELQVISPSFEEFTKRDPKRIEFRHLLVLNVAVGCTMVLNRSLVDLCLRGIHDNRVYMHDWWSMLVASAFGRVGYVDEPLSLYRQHGSNAVGAAAYSKLDGVLRYRRLTEKHAKTVQQAEAFFEAYEDLLMEEQRKTIIGLVGTTKFAAGDASLVSFEAAAGNRDLVGLDELPSRRQACGMQKVWAVIVTHEPDLARLEENLTAIVPQVQGVVVYDNGSDESDTIRRVVQDVTKDGRSLRVVLGGRNAGLAVALNAGIEEAWNHGATHVLLLDQDSVADSEMVQKLLAQTTEGVAIVSPLIVDRNVEAVSYDRGSTYAIRRAITSGSLLSVSAWRDVGGYDERLFVDWVDFEFCDALRKRGWVIIRTHSTALLHEHGRQERFFSALGRDYTGRWDARKTFYRQNYPAWRWRDRARSQAIVMRTYAGTRIGLEELGMFLKGTVGRAGCIERCRASNLRAIAAGLWEGVWVCQPRTGCMPRDVDGSLHERSN